MKIRIIAISAVLFSLILSGCKTIETEIIIDAPREEVWGKFTEFNTYPDWNPFIRTLETDDGGIPEVGEKIFIVLTPKEDSNMEFRPTVKVSDDYELVWLGRVGIPGIFDGKHRFVLEEINETTTRFIQSENFSGILVPFISLKDTEQGFINFNNALKERIEDVKE